jgi:hypothetical protein
MNRPETHRRVVDGVEALAVALQGNIVRLSGAAAAHACLWTGVRVWGPAARAEAVEQAESARRAV